MLALDYNPGVFGKPRVPPRAWFQLLRLEYQGDNLLAYFAASALATARSPERFSLAWLLVGVATLILAQAALELLDGYHDFMQGAHGRKDGEPTWTGGSGVLAEGRVNAAWAERIAWALGGVACAGFLLLVWGRTGVAGFVIGTVGCFAGACWAMPPVKLSYRGLGEVVVAIVAGPLMTAQGWIVAVGELELAAFLIGVPFGLLQLAMALAHGIIDHDADARVGKNTLVVRIGRVRAARVHAWASALVFVSIVVLSSARLLPWSSLIALCAAPFALQATRLVGEAARSETARRILARSYPPYKLLVAAGIVLAASGLGSAWLSTGTAGTLLTLTFSLVYLPVFVLLVQRWRLS
jgi:1,4-dihydroxy-2-naphthoate octaprenyltransferase